MILFIFSSLFFFSFYYFFHHFRQKLVSLLIMELMMICLIYFLFFLQNSSLCSFSFFTAMLFLVFMVLDSVLGLCLLIFLSRGSHFHNSLFSTI